MTTTITKLPSEEEADEAFQEIISSTTTETTTTETEACRDLFMNIIQYATMYQYDNKNDDNDKNDSIKNEEMIEKSNEASTFLINALNRFYDKYQKQHNNNDDDDDIVMEDDTNDNNNDDNNNNAHYFLNNIKNVIEDTMIDIIWLVGLLLEPTKPYLTPQQQQQKQQQEQQNQNQSQNQQSSSSSSLLHPIISSIQYKTLCNFIENLHEQDILPTDKLAKRLEPSLLSSLNGVILKSNKPTSSSSSSTTATTTSSIVMKRSNMDIFFKKLRKINTDAYYRQKRFNLLPEESEGYAKLFNFLNGGLLMIIDDSNHDDHNHNDNNNNNNNDKNDNVNHSNSSIMSLEEKQEQVKLQITEYIGIFDLDPNRCLDITLDSLEYQIQSMMMSSSSSSMHNMCDMVRHAPEHAYCISLLLSIISMFPVDNITHMIGFKYSSYKSSESSNNSSISSSNGQVHENDGKVEATSTSKETNTKVAVNDTMIAPKSLHYTTAILVSHGYVSLHVLIPHLSPSVSATMDQYKIWSDGYIKQIRKTGIVSLNSSNNNQNETSNNENKLNDHKDEKGTIYGFHDASTATFCDTNQFIQLLNVMIEIGLPWDTICSLFQVKSDISVENEIKAICCMYKPIEKNLCIYLKRMIDKAYKANVNQIGSELVGIYATKVTNNNKYTFGKHSLLPASQTHDHGVSESSTLLEFCDLISKPLALIIVSGAIEQDPTLYCMMCRLFRALFDNDIAKITQNGSEVSDNTSILNIIQEPSVLTTLKSFIVPSLSLFPYNPAISSEVWNVLSVLPYQIRYAMYALWRQNGLEKAALRSIKRSDLFSPKPLKQIQSEVLTSIETKYNLKRMSKDNIRDMGKQISKVAHNNPLVVFTLILNQIESYDNLILMMVDMFKFMGSLSLDVMGYCLLLRLGGDEKGTVKNKLKDDGVNVAQWLSSLETFAGAFYKMFTNVEIRGLLVYFTKRLHDGYCLELGVLRSLLKMAGGYGFADADSIASLSQVQLDGRCGSLLLKRETSDFGVVEIVNLNSSRRLRSSLQEDSCGVTYLILLSQLRTRMLFDDSASQPKQIKLIGNLYDTCQRTLNILLAFLTDGTEDKRDTPGAIACYAKSLPNLGELIHDFGLSAPSVWALCRPLLRAATFIAYDSAKEKKNKSENKMDIDLPEYLQSYHPSSTEMQNECKQMIEESNWKHITPLVYQRFFTFDVSDLFCPEESYKNEISRLKKEVERLLQLQRGGREAAGMLASLSAKAAAAGGTDREIRQATAFTREHERELERYKRNVDYLSTDLERQKQRCQSVHLMLKEEKDKFFDGLEEEEGELMTPSVFLANCLYPRMLQSAQDAMYCAHFIKVLHHLETPGFHTLQLLDGVVNAVVGALYSITEDEAGCLGIFFENMWNLISDWRYDELKYNNEVFEKSGSLWKDSDKEGDFFIPHDKYIGVYDRWHLSLGTAFIGCLQSKEYMHNRTGLILLMRLVSHFPTKSTIGEKILHALQPLQDEKNPMQDIRTMAQAYSAQLIKARSDGLWKEESEEETKEREEREKQLQEEKRLQREKNIKEMDKEMGKDIEGAQRQFERDTRRRSGQLTPPLQRMGDRGPNPQRDRDGRLQRDQRPMQQDRGPPPQQGMQGRRERDSRRRDDNRDNRDNRNHPGENDGGKTLHGRWEGNTTTNDKARRSSKRERSPARGSSPSRDSKRARREPSPRSSNRRRR